MSKPTLEERIKAQLQTTEQLYQLWQQSLGALTMLRELAKEEDECTDSDNTGPETDQS